MERIAQKKVIPVCVIDDPADACHLAQALLDADLPMIEVTLRTPSAVESIRRIRETFPDMLTGAGTVMTEDQVRDVYAAGAHFAVAPGLNETVVEEAQKHNLPFMPGVMTPSDIERALYLGCRIQKFFPAEAAGGVAMLKALAGPYASSGVKFIPLGGVNGSNMASYLALDCVAAIGGTWIASRTRIQGKQWKEITAQAREALAAARRT
jgi:2-dehydro-3-deoxyphosphogluconate aldolase / (4S)-4-hydroxy-2-oxoglutarate aldolase